MQWHLPWVWLPPSKVQLPAKRMPFHKHLRQDERLKFRCLEFFHIFPTFTSHPPKNVKFLHAFTSVPLPPRQQTFSQGTDSSTVYDGIQLELLPSMSQQVNCPLPLTGLFTCSDSRCKSYDIFGKTHPPWTQVGFLTIKDGKCRFPGDRLCAGGQHGTVQYHVALEAGRKQDLGSASLYGVVTRDLHLQNRVWGCIGGRGRMSYLHPLLACTCMTLKNILHSFWPSFSCNPLSMTSWSNWMPLHQEMLQTARRLYVKRLGWTFFNSIWFLGSPWSSIENLQTMMGNLTPTALLQQMIMINAVADLQVSLKESIPKNIKVHNIWYQRRFCCPYVGFFGWSTR